MYSVIEILQKKQGMNLNQAKKQFLLYYRSVKRNWGFEPNVEEFAQKIINIDLIVKRIRSEESGKTIPNGMMIKWKRN